MSQIEPLASIIKEAMRIEEDGLLASETHLAEARRWTRLHLMLGIPATIAAALAGVSAVANAAIVAVALAVTSAISSGLLTFLNPKENAVPHAAAAAQFKQLYNRARILREVDAQVEPIESLISIVKDLDAQRAKLFASVPVCAVASQHSARSAINSGDVGYDVDQWQKETDAEVRKRVVDILESKRNRR